MRIFCEKCNKIIQTKTSHQEELYSVFGLEVEVRSKVMRCSICGSEINPGIFDQDNIVKAYQKYAEITGNNGVKKIRK